MDFFKSVFTDESREPSDSDEPQNDNTPAYHKDLDEFGTSVCSPPHATNGSYTKTTPTRVSFVYSPPLTSDGGCTKTAPTRVSFICHPPLTSDGGCTKTAPTRVSFVCSPPLTSDGGCTKSAPTRVSFTKTLSVRVSYRQYETYELSHQIDLSQVLPEHLNFGFSASTGDRTATHDILSWEFSSTNFSLIAQDLPKEGGGVDRVLLVACVIGGSFLIFLGVALLCGFRYCKKRTRFDASNMDREFEHYMGPKKFSYKELVKATNKFAEEGKLGEGGFGEVYKGYLSYLNLTVAVKRGSMRSKQGRKEYMSEVKIISRLRHRNLVQLIGWCHEISKEFLLVYELLPNGSLDSHLFGRNRSILSWEVRQKIVLGLASALLYLHEESEQCVLHRDIKSSNIMLDSNFNAKLGDFGLARLVDEATGPRTTGLAGTWGYMAPEYINTSKASNASDVYSFGVVALEIACGRKSIERNSEEEDRVSLVSWVWAFYGSGRLLDVVDERLCMEFDVKQMECLLTVGLWCVHPDHNLRPSIKEVIQVLSFEAPLPDLPKNMPVPNYHAPENATIQVPLSTSEPTITYSSIFLGR
ncbi:L-type lectin-domain containing receptor kinase IX.1-like [Morus notabilis]|uniref:L-type lectin-domain containing receptor kinase IX.1-like n=1 Tax=Morus notabilis TaxID=981085 RepID=UPI000CED44E5|nr:L-type lectin-domain containing receptor kinase IX.1-like [Morus notabilis]